MPHKNSNKPNDKGGKPKPIRRMWDAHSSDVVLTGLVNECEASVLLDSGATITIVPDTLVEESLYDGESTAVSPYSTIQSFILPTAQVLFKIGELEWVERAAVVPSESPDDSRVLLSLHLKTERGLQLVLMANGVGGSKVRQVQTRAMSRKEQDEEQENGSIIERNPPVVRPPEKTVSVPTIEGRGLTGREKGS